MAQAPEGVEITAAVDLNGTSIDKYMRKFNPDGGRAIVGEIRQVYHLGGHVTVSYIPLFSRTEEMDEVTLAHDDIVWLFAERDLGRLTVGALL